MALVTGMQLTPSTRQVFQNGAGWETASDQKAVTVRSWIGKVRVDECSQRGVEAHYHQILL